MRKLTCHLSVDEIRDSLALACDYGVVPGWSCLGIVQVAFGSVASVLEWPMRCIVYCIEGKTSGGQGGVEVLMARTSGSKEI